jgi:membrane protein YdbS with pleckstrin-like domain
MFVPTYLVIAVVLLAGSAVLAFSQGQIEDFFAGTMAILGIVVMILTLVVYPLTRRRGQS